MANTNSYESTSTEILATANKIVLSNVELENIIVTSPGPKISEGHTGFNQVDVALDTVIAATHSFESAADGIHYIHTFTIEDKNINLDQGFEHFILEVPFRQNYKHGDSLELLNGSNTIDLTNCYNFKGQEWPGLVSLSFMAGTTDLIEIVKGEDGNGNSIYKAYINPRVMIWA